MKILKNIEEIKSKTVFCDTAHWVFVENYPSNTALKKYSTKKITRPLNKLIKWVRDWVSGPEIAIGEGWINMNNRWEEKPKSPSCVWTYRARFKANPLLTIKGDAITLQPKWLKKLIKKVKNSVLIVLFKDIDPNVKINLSTSGGFGGLFVKNMSAKEYITTIYASRASLGLKGSGHFNIEFQPWVKNWKVEDLLSVKNTGYAKFKDLHCNNSQIEVVDIVVGHKGLKLTATLIFTSPNHKKYPLWDNFTMTPVAAAQTKPTTVKYEF